MPPEPRSEGQSRSGRSDVLKRLRAVKMGRGAMSPGPSRASTARDRWSGNGDNPEGAIHMKPNGLMILVLSAFLLVPARSFAQG